MNQRNRGRFKRRPPWWVLYPDRYKELEAALKTQPQLRLSEINGFKTMRGRFRIEENDQIIDTFRVQIEIPKTYPRDLPTLFETEQRIPKIPDRHINPARGDACLYVPEEWKAIRKDDSFETWFNVPVRNFFLGQLYFEQHHKFPNKCERAHYISGLLDAYGDVLSVAPKEQTLHYWLRILSAKSSKGHWNCPCGSGRIIRKCCREYVYAKHQSIDRVLALEMLYKLTTYMEAKKKGKAG